MKERKKNKTQIGGVAYFKPHNHSNMDTQERLIINTTP